MKKPKTHEEKISTGTKLFDNFLDGGLEKNIITTVYGPSASGKTNFCMFPLIKTTGSGKKVIFVDTEGGFSVERLKQITKHHKEVMKRTIFFHPTSFAEQKKAFENIKIILKDEMKKKLGLIIIDSISFLYRLELGKSRDIYNVNVALGEQLSMLLEVTRKLNIPVLITNQVYADFENKNCVKMVGGDILKNGSKSLIELKKGVLGNRMAVLRKHRSLPEKNIKFKIIEKGFEEN